MLYNYQEFITDPELSFAMMTDAPIVYDYASTTQCGWIVSPLVRHPLRIVVVPCEDFDYQRDRYLSGLYIASPLERK